MTERPTRHIRILFVVILVYLVIVNGVAYWQQKNGDHFYVCTLPSEQTYVLAQATCSKGECTSKEYDATGEVRAEATYTAGTIYTDTTDTLHSGCIEVTAKEAETLAPVPAQKDEVPAEESGLPDDTLPDDTKI